MKQEYLCEMNEILGRIKAIDLYDLEKEAEKENDLELKNACEEAYLKLNTVNVLLYQRMKNGGTQKQ